MPPLPRCRPPPTHVQTRTESRSTEETRKAIRGCFKLITVVPTWRSSWKRQARRPGRGPGLRPPGAPGRWARARCGPSPSPSRRRRDAYFSQSRCGRRDPARAEEPSDPPIRRGFRVGLPSSRRDRVLRAPPLLPQTLASADQARCQGQAR